MHIIIVGCGKVGSTLAEQLQEEDTDLTNRYRCRRYQQSHRRY